MAVDAYREIIEHFAQNHIDARISNGMVQHASALIETMLDHAKVEVRIFTGTFDRAFYGKTKIVEAAQRFLSRPYARLRILIQKGAAPAELKAHPMVRAIQSMQGVHGEIEIWAAVGSYMEEDADHFTVMDSDGFRFETHHEECKAVANFNEPKTAKKLVEAFDKAVRFSGQINKQPLLRIPPSAAC